MRNKAGFTLIELLVGMLVTMLIMGALVSLFSSTVQSQMSGFKQQEVYAQARALMNDLKTTLRYADSAAVFYQGTNSKTPITAPKENTGAVKNIDSVEYTATIYNSSMAANESVKMTVEWMDNSKKQIKITKEVGTSSKESYFPNSTDNSVFKGDGSDFPITVNKEDDSLYHINLPYKYTFALSGDKTDTLITDVLKGEEAVGGSGFPPLLITGAGKLVLSSSGSINVDGESTLVIKFQNVDGKLNSSSKFEVLTNNSSIADNSNHISVVDYYEYNGQKLSLSETINKFSRIDKYVIASSNGSAGNILAPIVFTSDEKINNLESVTLSGQNTVLMTINGNNGIWAQNDIKIDSGNKNGHSIILDSNTSKGSLIIYSDNKVIMNGVYIPKEIAVLIVSKNNDISITDCRIENCIIMSKGARITIDKSDIYGMIEYGGKNEFVINNNCDFGSFKGTPTAIEVFDKYFGYNG